MGMFPEMLTFSIRAYLKLRRLLPHQFDIIHDNQTLAYGLLLMKSLGIPLVATVHHPLPIDRDAALAQAESFWQKLEAVMFYPLFMQHVVVRGMSRVITDSESSATTIRRTFKVRDDRIRVIYPGVDTNIFRRRDGERKEKGGIIVVGNTEDRKKGILYLLQALQLLKGDLDVKLTIVDQGGPDAKFVNSLIRRYGLEGMVRFTGRISAEELASRYSASEIAVTASVYEGFGLPAAEAMACEVPVVATTAGALPEVVEDGKTGILVPPADATALAGAIKRLLGDEVLKRRLGEAGRRRVERCFSWRETARKTIEVYEEARLEYRSGGAP